MSQYLQRASLSFRHEVQDLVAVRIRGGGRGDFDCGDLAWASGVNVVECARWEGAAREVANPWERGGFHDVEVVGRRA